MNQNNSLDNLLQQGHLQIERGQYEAGLEIFQQADSLFPSNSRVKYGLGISLYSLKEYQKALCCFDEALKIDPQDHDSFSKKGICLANLGNFQSAIDNYDMALLIEQNDFVAWYCKGLALYMLNQHKGALYCYEKAIKIYPGLQPAKEDKQELIEHIEKAHSQLIQLLLNCPENEEEKILFDNQGLIEISLIEKIGDTLAKVSSQNHKIVYKHQSIINKINKYLEPKPNQAQIIFLQKMFIEFYQGIKTEKFNSLFYINLYLLDNNFSESLRFLVIKIYGKLDYEYQKIFENNIHQFITAIKNLPYGDRAENIDIAIAGSEILADIYFEKCSSLELASIYTNVGYFYRIRINGNNEGNLEKTIAYCNKTLNIYSENSELLNSEIGFINFTTAKFNLGAAYLTITCGEEEDNLEKAINYLQSTDAYTESQFPYEWATTQSQLGACYSKKMRGDRADNIEKAINYFQNSLRIFVEVQFKQEWAETQYNLANLYKIRIKENKAENIEQVIKHCQNYLQSYTKTNFSERWAEIQSTLAYMYSKRDKGDRAGNLENKIKCYEKALSFYNKNNYPLKYASINMQLALDYIERIKGKKEDNIEQAIDKLNLTLNIYKKNSFSFEWMHIQHSLGIAYMERKKGDKADNAEKSIVYLKNAVECFAKEHKKHLLKNSNLSETIIKKLYGEILHNLSKSYFRRIKGSNISNLEYALTYCQDSLKIRSKLESPQTWARTQDLLGCIYQEKINGDISDNLENAIKCHKSAFNIYKNRTNSEQLGFIYNNLGFDYQKRIKGDKANNLELSIAYFKDALTFFSESYKSDYWAQVNVNLGNSYGDRIKGDKTDNLEQAIKYYKNALCIHTEANYCFDWAVLQNDLGGLYGQRIKGDKADNLEQAIIYLHNALKYRQKSKYQIFWAKTKGNLADIYYQRVKENKASNLVKANKYFHEALLIFTPQDYPTECLRICRSHGFLLFTDKNWQQSINVYTIAIEAVEKIREWSSNAQNKQETISNAIEVYQNIVQACINLGQIDKAIEYVERGKARNLVDLLATKDLYPKGDIPSEIIVRLRTLRQEAIAEEKCLSQQRNLGNGFNSFDNGENRSFTDSASRNQALDPTRLNLIHQELDNLITKQIQPIDPSFKLTQNKPFSFEQIQATLPTQQTALIEWFIGDNTLSAFIVTHQQSTPVHFSYTKEQLNLLINTVVQYFDSYLNRDRPWQTVLPDLLIQLAENLQTEAIVEQIKHLVPDCDRLILVPHRWLHLLPIHAMPLSDSKCLLDLFTQGVSYAPSVQLLELTQKQNKPQLTNLFAVENPTEDPDLPFTKVEVTAIRSQFNPNDDVLIGKKGHKKALTKERLGQANCTHFSCHGVFNFERPELSALLLANSIVEEIGEQSAAEEEGDRTRFLANRDGGSIDLEQCLTLGEIFSLDLRNCRLVTLSACETGLTDFKSLSDEYIGLPSGFLYAGSPSVVSSLWAVSDLSTTFLMIKFYQNLQEIDSVAIALNQAQLWLRDLTKEELAEWKTTLDIGWQMYKIDQLLINMPDNSRPFASPYHWAAFCAVGS